MPEVEAPDADGRHPSVVLSLDKIQEIANLAVRRAAVFLGIAANVSAIDPPISHALDDKVRIDLVPQRVTPENARALVEEFEAWSMSCALRDLCEAFALFFVEVRLAAHIFEQGLFVPAEWERLRRLWDRDGVAKQFKEVFETLGLAVDYTPMFASLNAARNCLSHRRGVVGREDLRDGVDRLTITWPAWVILAVLADGSEVELNEDLVRKGLPFETEARIIAHDRMREKTFGVGETIRLSRHDLAEICLATFNAANHTRTKLLAYAEIRGVQIRQPIPPGGEREQVTDT